VGRSSHTGRSGSARMRSRCALPVARREIVFGCVGLFERCERPTVSCSLPSLGPRLSMRASRGCWPGPRRLWLGLRRLSVARRRASEHGRASRVNREKVSIGTARIPLAFVELGVGRDDSSPAAARFTRISKQAAFSARGSRANLCETRRTWFHTSLALPRTFEGRRRLKDPWPRP
jgi:hypothetical protein